MAHEQITSEQLDAAAKLIRMGDSKSRAAARLVLVEGLSGDEAAERIGVTASTVSGAVGRVLRAIDLARVAAGCAGGNVQ